MDKIVKNMEEIFTKHKNLFLENECKMFDQEEKNNT